MSRSVPRFSLVGREAELDAVFHFLDDRPPATTLVFHGESGIGKTALWQSAIDVAATQGFHVLSTRCSEGEGGLLFAAIADLVDRVGQEILDRVPSPQRRALDIALRRVAGDSAPPDPFTIFSGFLSAIRALSLVTRPLIAVDDVQWLDPSSADCLLFLARRVSADQIRFILSRRGGHPSSLERALEPLAVRPIEVGPLSRGAISRVLADRFGVVMPRRVQYQLHEMSHGNPLFALELGRLIHESGLPDIDSELFAPREADAAFDARVRALSAAVRRVLLAVTLCPHLTRHDLMSIVDPLALDDALDDDLLALERSRVRPVHPMLAAASRRLSSAAERHELHLDLATLLSDPVLRARHLSSATPKPDAAVAATVAAATQLAADRGAVHEAEELAARALRLTPPGAPEEPDRILTLGHFHLAAGDVEAAAKLVHERLHQLPPGRQRALGHLLLAEAEGFGGETHLDLAIAEAPDDVEVQGLARCRKATALAAYPRRLVEAEATALEGLRFTEGTAEQERGRAALAWALLLRGKDMEHLRTDSRAARPGLYLCDAVVFRPAGIRRAFRGEVAEAIQILRGGSELVGEGDPILQGALTVQLCEVALRIGDVTEFEALLPNLDLGVNISEVQSISTRLKTVAAAIRGHPAQVRQLAASVFDDSTEAWTSAWDRLETHRALGLAALLEGDAHAAVTSFATVWSYCRSEGIDDPGAFPVAGDLVEALVASGQLEHATSVIEELEWLSREQEHPWGLTTSGRCWATIDVARGDYEKGSEELLAASSAYGEMGLQFEAARCLVLAVRALRRSRKRAAARDALADAATSFRHLGCDGWEEQALSESARLSGRRSSAEDELTPSQRRVAELAAQGLSNKEIAAELFVSVYTVQTHLRQVYARLGVRSRSQLSRAIGNSR